MVHYSCDACKRPIHPHNDVHHVVKIEIFPAVDDHFPAVDHHGCDCHHEDADHLEKMEGVLAQHLLEEGGDADRGEDGLDEPRRMLRFDLCDACRERFLRNPLGAALGKQLDFSAN
ncbi:MAG: hypothetical protein ACKOCW_02180 [Planctomycetaceae bacterium]